jgi:hypothetical protein
MQLLKKNNINECHTEKVPLHNIIAEIANGQPFSISFTNANIG